MPPERYPTILLLSSDRLIRSVMKEALDDAGCFVRATGVSAPRSICLLIASTIC